MSSIARALVVLRAPSARDAKRGMVVRGAAGVEGGPPPSVVSASGFDRHGGAWADPKRAPAAVRSWMSAVAATAVVAAPLRRSPHADAEGYLLLGWPERAPAPGPEGLLSALTEALEFAALELDRRVGALRLEALSLFELVRQHDEPTSFVQEALARARDSVGCLASAAIAVDTTGRRCVEIGHAQIDLDTVDDRAEWAGYASDDPGIGDPALLRGRVGVPLPETAAVRGGFVFAGRAAERAGLAQTGFSCLDQEYLRFVASVLARALDLLIAKRDRSQWVKRMTHQTKSPLFSISGALNMLSARPNLPEAIRTGQFARALIHVQRIERTFSAHSPEAPPLTKKTCALRKIVETAIWTCRPQAEAARIEWGPSLVGWPPDDPITIEADEHALGDVFDNIFDNAVRYRQAGREDEFALEIRYAARGDEHVISISSSGGVGIPAEDVERVFELEYRTDAARRLNPNGLGIGLEYARGRVAAHGGRLAVTRCSNPTTFEMRLPVVGAGAP